MFSLSRPTLHSHCTNRMHFTHPSYYHMRSKVNIYPLLPKAKNNLSSSISKPSRSLQASAHLCIHSPTTLTRPTHLHLPKPERAKYNKKPEKKTYNSGDSPVVTHLTTSPPVRCLNRAERTGSLVFNVLWSYVKVKH
jgi:hypothetical protein